MGKSEAYQKILQAQPSTDWKTYLLQESGLPGPRGNLELAQVVADLGDLELFRHYLTYDAEIAPTNTPEEFLAFCGVVGLGRLVAAGQKELLVEIRSCAQDRRWRLREGTAMALQRVGQHDMDELLGVVADWVEGSWLEKRAAIAALAEPALLKDETQIRLVFDLFDKATAALLQADDRKMVDFRVLRQGLAYAWSVVAAALPVEGQRRMERWFLCDDGDVRWVMKENLKKKRLAKIDPEWVASWQERLS